MDFFKNAKWIWCGHPYYDLINSWMEARYVFELEEIPKKVPIAVTADTHYKLFINGKYVCRGPVRGFQEEWLYDVVDISPYLKKGKNVICSIVHSLGISNFQYIHQGTAGFILGGKVGKADISTGKSWRVRKAPEYRRVLTRVSLQLGFQEFFDARIEDDWLKEDYHSEDWEEPIVMEFGCMPWNSLKERDIPLFKEEIIYPKEIVSFTQGESSKNYRDAQDVVSLYTKERREWKKTYKTFPLKILPTGVGSFYSICVDFGKEIVGSLRLKVEGAKGGEIVDILVTELLDEKGRPVIKSPDKAGCKAAFGNRLYLKEGKTEWEQFDYWGFRYVVLVVRDSLTPLRIEVELRKIGYPLEVRSEFETSDEVLNKIYNICVHTQKCCMLDAYVDCPWREQAQWWGDARIQAQNTFFISPDPRLLKRGIRQIGYQQIKNGLTYGHAPTIAHRCILLDFTLVWLLTHHDYYWQTGDLSLFKEMKGRILKALSYFEEKSFSGLLAYDNRYWLFLDWAPIFKEGYPTPYNLLYLYALKKIKELFLLTGEREILHQISEKEERLKVEIKEKLFDKGKKILFAGLDWEKRPVRKEIPHSYALAILSDLLPPLNHYFAKNYFLPLLTVEKHECFPSPYFMFYVFQALKKTGYRKEVIEFIRLKWGDWLRKGYSTTPEVWEIKAGIHSLCHAWSAHPVVHFANILLGIWQESPAWREIKWEPLFWEDLEFAQGKVPTPEGIIEVVWKREDKNYRAEVSLPEGIYCKVCLPDREEEIRGKGSFIYEGRV